MIHTCTTESIVDSMAGEDEVLCVVVDKVGAVDELVVDGLTEVPGVEVVIVVCLVADNVVVAVMAVDLLVLDEKMVAVVDVVVVVRVEESTVVHPTNPTIMHETQILVSHNFFLNIIHSY
jgi:hypothetical protein